MKNAPAEKHDQTGQNDLSNETVCIGSQTRSKTNSAANKENSLMHETASKKVERELGHEYENDSILNLVSGSPSAVSTPLGGNEYSPTLDRIRSESEFSFIYNPLTPPKKLPLIGEKERGDVKKISDALNEMYEFMQANQLRIDSFAKYSQQKFSKLDGSIEAISNRVDFIETANRENVDTISCLREEKAPKKDLEEMKLEMGQMKTDFHVELQREVSKLETVFQAKLNEAIESKLGQQESIRKSLNDQQLDLNAQRERLNDMALDIQRVANAQALSEEKANAHDIQTKHLFLTIDGLPENEDKSVIDTIIDRFNNDAKGNLSPNDFLSAYRVANEKFDKAGTRLPQQIKVKMSSEKSRNKLLSCRGKLQANPNKSTIWLNEVHPDDYRRRKLMLRELVKHINKIKGMRATIESGGIRLNGQFYGPDEFEDLPPDCQPRAVQIISVGENSLAFAGEWAFLSNMYNCPVRYDGIRFLSSEQAYQHTKAMTHGAIGKATRILLARNAFVCKRYGDKIEDSEDWLKIREGVLQDIIYTKFKQNPHLKRQLLETKDATLLEATVDSFWGTGAGLRSKATREVTAGGENKTGHILMNTRARLVQEQDE